MDMVYQDYFDKVYGCWLGKTVCGNIGAPFEGMKQKLNISFHRDMVDKMLPNDDLDLQVLFLDVVKKYGSDFTSEQLAESFVKNCPYAPGEYAYFKKNFKSGILPPLSGSFNNEVYRNGMGCLIRSELWACLAPNDPERAIEYCVRDGCLDHCGDGLYGEIFMTALQSLAFSVRNEYELVARALAFIPADCRLAEVIRNTVQWTRTDLTYAQIRDQIVAVYGSAEATSVFQNLGFILLGLLRGSEDLLQSAIEVCGCGFDTDCTCATLGAIKGILLGAAKLNQSFDFSEVTYQLGVTAEKRSDRVYDLSEEIAELGAVLNGFVGYTPKYVKQPFAPVSSVVIRAEYTDGRPSIGFGETKRVRLHICNPAAEDLRLQFSCEAPLILDRREAVIAGGAEQSVVLTVQIDRNASSMAAENVVTVRYGESGVYRFGFMGKRRYTVYGPFWKNNVEVPQLREQESYWNYFPAETAAEQMDKIRFYHTNCLAREIAVTDALDSSNYLCEFDNSGDAVTLEDHLSFEGQAYYVLQHTFVSPRAFRCDLQLGYNSALEFYLNERKLAVNGESAHYTPENAHCFGVDIREGENVITIKIKKCGDRTRFSFDFLENGACSNHITNFFIKK